MLTASYGENGVVRTADFTLEVMPLSSRTIAITQQPPFSAQAGTSISPAVAVKICDHRGNIITSDNSTRITAEALTASLQKANGMLSNAAITFNAGYAVFSNLRYDSAETIILKFTVEGVAPIQSTSITVRPGPFDHFRITPNGPQTAGNPIRLTVSAKDANENTVTGYSSNGTLSIAETTGIITWSGTGVADAVDPAGSFTAAAFSAGIANIDVNNTAADFGKAVIVTDGPTGKSGTAKVSWTPGSLDRFTISDIFVSQIAGKNFSITISALDANGNVVKDFSSTAALSDLTATLEPAVTGNFTNGVWSGDVAIKKAGATNRINISAVKTGVSNDFEVKHGTASKMTLRQVPPSSVIAGQNFGNQIRIDICDAYGNIIDSDDSSAVTATLSGQGGSTLDGTLTVTAAKGVASFTNLSYNKAEDIKLKFYSGSLTPLETATIRILPAAIASYSVSSSSPQLAGSGFSGTITAKDRFGNIVTTDNSTAINVKSNGSVIFYTNVSYSTTTTSYTLNSGAANYFAKDTKTENIVITAKDGNNVTGVTNAITINPLTASKLVIARQPSETATAGLRFQIQPAVNVCDAYGNIIAGDNSTQITAAISGAGGPALQGTLAITVSNGSAAFTNLSHNAAETLKINFTAAGIAPVESGAVAVSPSAIASYSISSTSPQTAGSGFSGVITAKDQYSNVVATDNSTVVNISSPSATGVFYTAGDCTIPTISYRLSSGIANYYFKDIRSGIVTVTAADANSKTGVSNSILINPAALGRFDITSNSPQTAGNAVTLTVKACDAHGNVITGYNSPGGLTITGATGAITWSGGGISDLTDPDGSYNGTGFVSGISTIGVKNTAADANKTLTVTDSATGSSGTAVVSWIAGNLDHFEISAIGATQTAGVQIAVTITAKDSSNNIIPGFTSTAAISDTTGTIAPQSTGTFIGGVWNGTVTITKAGTGISLNVAAAGKPGTSNTFAVNAGAAAALAIKTQPSSSAAAGAPFAVQPQIAVCDGFGNTLTSDNSTQVTAARGSSGTSTLSGVLTRTAVNGIVSFTNLTYSKAETMKIDFTSAGLAHIESNSITVAGGTPAKIVIVTQPSETGNAGSAFARQPSVKLRDAYDNDSKTPGVAISASIKTGTGTLQGTLTITTDANGTAPFTNLSGNKAETITLQFSGAGLTPVESNQISLTSNIADFNYTDNGSSISITGYTGSGGAVIIPDYINGKPVTILREVSFSGRSSITSIIIPAGVTTIGNQAFEFCNGLSAINIPANVSSIGNMAFEDCKNLTAINVNPSNANFSNDEFGVLYDKNKTKLIKFPTGVTIIGASAFRLCQNLTSVTIPAGVTTIDTMAFQGTGLTSVAIPVSVATIGSIVFCDTLGLNTINVDAANSAYSSLDGVLYNKSKTEIIHYPQGRAGAFSIPQGVISINEMAFWNCAALTEVTIPSSVVVIYYSAFNKCTGLTRVSIPASVSSIYIQAFKQCTSLTSAIFTGNAPALGADAFSGCAPGFKIYYSPAGSGWTSPTWNGYPSICEFEFTDNSTSITITKYNGLGGAVTIPSLINNKPVSAIGDWAFSMCESMTSVNIPGSVTSIGKCAFFYCNGLSQITIPNSVTTIGEQTFASCDGLTSVSIGTGASVIGQLAFQWCTSLTTITVNASNPNYSDDNGVLYNKNKTCLLVYPAGKTDAYNIPASVDTIGNQSFYGCLNLTTFNIPTSIRYFGQLAFMECRNLTTFTVDPANTYFSAYEGMVFNKDRTTLVSCPIGKQNNFTIPAGVTRIGIYAFFGCKKITTITIPEGVSIIDYGAFDGCGLTSINVPDSVSTLGGYAFNGCTLMGSVSIGSGVTSIGERAFSFCSPLTYVYFRGNAPATFGNNVFAGCAASMKIYCHADKTGWTMPTWNGYPTEIY